MYSNFELNILIYYFKEKIYTRNYFLSKEGENGDNIYILVEGNLQLMCNFNINLSQNDSRTGVSLQKQMNMKLTECNTNELIGEEILLKKSYEYTVQVISKICKVYEIKKSDLIRFFSVDVLKFMKQNYKKKDKFR